MENGAKLSKRHCQFLQFGEQRLLALFGEGMIGNADTPQLPS